MAERAQTQIKPTAVPNLPTAGGTLQRKCACGTHTLGDKCDSCKGGAGPLQRKASGRTGYSEVPPIVHEALRSPGQPLDAGTRAFFGPRFDHDFSHVRVHTDSTAARSARAVNARAYTVGPDIVFGAGLYRPRNETGHRLLAHELVHVIQNRGSALTRMPLQVNEPGDESEREADRLSKDVLYPVSAIRHSVVPSLQRKAAASESGAKEKRVVAEDSYIRCLRALMEQSQWRYSAIKSKHRNLPFSKTTYRSISTSLQSYLNQDISIACERDSNYFCCGTISSVIVREAPPSKDEERTYGESYGRGDEEGLSMLEEEVKVKGGSYFIDLEINMSLKEEDCCPPEPPKIVA